MAKENLADSWDTIDLVEFNLADNQNNINIFFQLKNMIHKQLEKVRRGYKNS